ncbi:sensor histidine kinase [Candidatus Peregrinibacteria bacterium]|jgi:hypothetical protein|nr:sensor histidine kinase [Candidatus Peregrinibacteria bacterium]MBT4056044.1 sensor histidine kinase [Candidatus Peregrinibacteria bacterium]
MREIPDIENLNYGLTDPKDQVPEPTPAYLEMCENDPEMSGIAFSCEWIKIMMTKITATNTIMLRSLGAHFEKLCFAPPKKVFEYLGIDIGTHHQHSYAQRIDTLHSILQYAPLLNGDYDADVVKSLLHFRISKILMKISIIIGKMVSGEEDSFSSENLVKLVSDVTALMDIKTEDIANAIGLTDEDSLSRIQTSLHDLRNNFAPLLEHARNLNDGEEPAMEPFFRRGLSQPKNLELIKYAAHLYGETLAPSAPSPHQAVGLVSSALKSCSKMAEDHDLVPGKDFEIEFEIKEGVTNGHTVIANRTRFLEVVKNFFRNAIDSTKPGHKCKFKVVVEITGVGDTCIKIIDNGTGLSPQVLTRLFHEQLSIIPEGTDGKYFGGEGVGLLGSAVFVRDMGGSIPVYRTHSKEPGYDGAEFWIHLPTAFDTAKTPC